MLFNPAVFPRALQIGAHGGGARAEHFTDVFVGHSRFPQSRRFKNINFVSAVLRAFREATKFFGVRDIFRGSDPFQIAWRIVRAVGVYMVNLLFNLWRPNKCRGHEPVDSNVLSDSTVVQLNHVVSSHRFHLENARKNPDAAKVADFVFFAPMRHLYFLPNLFRHCFHQMLTVGIARLTWL